MHTWNSMTKTLLILTILLSSCSARWHVNQAIKKGLKIGTDTVYQEKTVIVPGDSTTVFVPVTRLKDSLVTVYQDRIKIQYRLKHDTIRFNVECDADTIKVNVPVYVNTEINCPKPNPFWRILAFALMVVTGLVLYFRRWWKYSFRILPSLFHDRATHHLQSRIKPHKNRLIKCRVFYHCKLPYHHYQR